VIDSDPAESLKLRQGRRMARSLRSQAQDESHQRITEQVRGQRPERVETSRIARTRR
jgi:hypothetical protein